MYRHEKRMKASKIVCGVAAKAAAAYRSKCRRRNGEEEIKSAAKIEERSNLSWLRNIKQARRLTEKAEENM
jgi:hypothetical protein